MELKESKVEIDIQEKPMSCTSNFEDQSFYNLDDNIEDQCNGDDKNEIENEEEEVDIIETSSYPNKIEIEISECNDGTDDVYSSSFSGTDSEHHENDQEADSLPICVKKKKLTDHWRRFIQPIMWRCKWLELKIKEFQNQARMYDKELEESSKAKQLELENRKSEELGVKGQPSILSRSRKNRIIKRRKRKRIEETSDVAAYTLNHNLFSYYEHRKSFADVPLNDNSRNLDKKSKSSKEEIVFNEETPTLEFREGDAYVEQMLLKIEAAKLELSNLKIRVDKVLEENPSRFFSEPDDTLTSLEQQKPELVIKNEDEKPVISEEKPVKSASMSSHNDTQTEEDEDTKDILLSEILASKRREGKGIVLEKKLKKTEQVLVEEGPSRSVRKRTPRNLDIVVKEESIPKRRRVTREKPKTNVTMASKFKNPNRKRKRGKRRSASVGLRRRS